MRKINSIGYGGKILNASLFFSLVIPGIIKIFTLFYQSAVLTVCAGVSFGFGIIIMLFLITLLMVEFHQDNKLNLYYEAQKNIKLDLGKGMYECQACGNRAVKSEDKSCSICNILFGDADE